MGGGPYKSDSWVAVFLGLTISANLNYMAWF